MLTTYYRNVKWNF